MSQSLQYGGIHDSHFKHIQTTITSLFPGQFWKLLHQNKWLVNPCHAEYIKMPHPLLIFNQSDYLIWIVAINSYT